jgi:hypothetical protein
MWSTANRKNALIIIGIIVFVVVIIIVSLILALEKQGRR